jgi:hypothetical protein
MASGWTVEFYRTGRGGETAKVFVESLDVKARAKVTRWLEMLEEKGPAFPRPYADVLDGPIRELRVGHGRLEIRLLYFFRGRSIIIVAHGFLKKTRSVPVGEVLKAHRAHADWLIRHGGST